jgi:hypothetical protein
VILYRICREVLGKEAVTSPEWIIHIAALIAFAATTAWALVG